MLLEELLGRPLFARDGRASRFTADGERLIEYARRIVAMNDEAVSTFTRPELTGTIRFGTPDDYADRFLPEILARFSRTHPLVTVDVECLTAPCCSTGRKGRDRSGAGDLGWRRAGEPVRRVFAVGDVGRQRTLEVCICAYGANDFARPRTAPQFASLFSAIQCDLAAVCYPCGWRRS
jgi:hypothetical protein